MKLSYFPYLPNSKNEDNKRYKYICDKIEKDPFTYHKKKNSSFLFDKYYIVPQNNLDLNTNQNKVNQELLFFQNENDKYINSFNNFMKKKSSIIEDNTENYLNYISHNKKLKNLESSDTNNTNVNNEINSYFSYFHKSQKNKSKTSLFKNKSESDLIGLSSKRYNNELYNTKSIETEKNNFIPSLIKAKGSDITNPFFYDQVAKEIIQKNQEVMAYNIQESEYKLKKKKITSKFSDDKIAIAPGKINNPNYYNLGESFLTKNPILNKGNNYSPSFSYNANYFNRHKNIFGK